MRVALFLSRIAFVCNIFFLLALLLMWRNFIGNPVWVSTIGIAGYFLVAVFNPLANLWCFILLLRKRLLLYIPRWLAIFNFIFLLLQLQYILFLNDTFHS